MGFSPLSAAERHQHYGPTRDRSAGLRYAKFRKVILKQVIWSDYRSLAWTCFVRSPIFHHFAIPDSVFFSAFLWFSADVAFCTLLPNCFSCAGEMCSFTLHSPFWLVFLPTFWRFGPVFQSLFVKRFLPRCWLAVGGQNVLRPQSIYPGEIFSTTYWQCDGTVQS